MGVRGFANAFVNLGARQAFEHGGPCPRITFEKLGKSPLRQQNRPGKRIVSQPHAFLDLRLAFPAFLAAIRPLTISDMPQLEKRARRLLQFSLTFASRPVLHEPGAIHLPVIPFKRHRRHTVCTPARHDFVARRTYRRKTRGAAIKSKTNRVQNRRLSGPRVPRNQKKGSQIAKIDFPVSFQRI